VFRTNPFATRLFSRLVTQLVPAALVTGVGILMLSNLAKAPDTTPPAPSVETAINAEAVFKITPREPEAPAPAAAIKSAAPRAVAAPKQVAGTTVNTALPPRRPVNDQQVASAPAPLPTVQIPAQPQVTATAASDGNSPGRGQLDDGQAPQRHCERPADSAMDRSFGGGLVLRRRAATPAAGLGADAELPGFDVA
jgi:hypothetical protein